MKRLLAKQFVAIVMIVACFVTGILHSPKTAYAVYPIDFGGRVLMITICANGLWVLVGPPTPGLFFYAWGISGLKLHGPPYMIGQAVLGKTAGVMACLVPCIAGLCPIGFGFLVTPNAGSSALPAAI